MAKTTERLGRGAGRKPGRRYEMTDEAWERIEPLLPKQGRGGRWNDHRTMLNGMFWVLNSGAPWRDLPERYGRWQSVYDRYRRWTREGLFDRILHRLHVQLDAEGRIDWSVFDVDGTNIRADRSAAGARKKGAKPSPRTTGWDDPAEALVRSFIW
jgi:transposase